MEQACHVSSSAAAIFIFLSQNTAEHRLLRASPRSSPSAESFKCEKCSPSPLAIGGFSPSFQPFFLNAIGFISAILTPIWSLGDTAGQGRTCLWFVYVGTVGEAGVVTVLSVPRTGHLHGTDVLKLSLVSKDVGVCTPGSCSRRQFSPIRIRIEDCPS